MTEKKTECISGISGLSAQDDSICCFRHDFYSSSFSGSLQKLLFCTSNVTYWWKYNYVLPFQSFSCLRSANMPTNIKTKSFDSECATKTATFSPSVGHNDIKFPLLMIVHMYNVHNKEWRHSGVATSYGTHSIV